MASNYGLISFFKALLLQDVTQPYLIRFKTEYTAYKDKVTDINQSIYAENQLPVASSKECFNQQTFHALWKMGDIEGASTLEEATTENVKAWFDVAQAAYSNV